MIALGTLYWIKPDGEIVDISSQHYDNHAIYIQKHFKMSSADAYEKAFADGWIRIRVRSVVAGVELKVPSISSKAVDSLKDLMSQLNSSMSIALQNYRKVADNEVYSVNRFLKVYQD